MSAETETPQIPYFEDNNRKGASRGEAMFGDKRARLLEGIQQEPQSDSDISPEASEIVQNITEHDTSRYEAGKAAAMLALNEAAARGGDKWPEGRYEAAKQQIDRQFANQPK